MTHTHKNIKKKWIAKRTAAMFLVLALLCTSTISVLAFAANDTTPKQEVVYINLNSDGTVDNVYVVNIFDLNENKKIIDYGNYTALRNMNTNDEIVFQNETITIDAKAGKLYYEGILDSNIIPWDFSISYFLDGTQYKANEIAGKSGALKIKMSVRENTDCDSPFFENYALQASFTLDTKLCKNIVAKDATTANVGRKKQITYTILPNKGADVEISADVTDFEMDGIAINGVPLSMNLDVKVENNEDINEATDGIAKLDDGASDITSGAAELRDGASDLKDGASDIKSGAKDLQSGSKKLFDGSNDVKQGAKDLHTGISELYSKIPQLIAGSNSIGNGLSDAKTGANDLANGAKGIEAGASELKNGADSLSAGLNALSSKSSELVGGAYTVFASLTTQAERQINQSLSGTGVSTISLTPETYGAVLTGLLQSLGGSTTSSPEQPPDTIKPNIYVVPEELSEPVATQTPTDPVVPESPSAEEEATPDNANSDLLNEDIPADLPQENTEKEQQTTDTETASILSAAPMLINLNTYSTKRTAALAANSKAQGGGDSYQTILAIKTQLDEYNQFYLGLKEYTNTVGTAALGADNLKSGADALALGTSGLREGTTALNDGIVVLSNGSAELNTGLSQLQSGCGKLLDGAISLEDGTIQLHNGITELSDGTLTLEDGCVEMLDGAAALYDGSVTLYDGTLELKDGTLEFKDKTADLDTTINDKITSAINDMMGTDFKPVSFVSDKNTNIEFVQFVVKTDGIFKLETEAAIEVQNEPLTFWQKLLKLFGWE